MFILLNYVPIAWKLAFGQRMWRKHKGIFKNEVKLFAVEEWAKIPTAQASYRKRVDFATK